MNSDGFISGVWCGGILGAALMLLMISLCMAANEQAENLQANRQLRKMRERGW